MVLFFRAINAVFIFKNHFPASCFLQLVNKFVINNNLNNS
jgi:hypothetical protein